MPDSKDKKDGSPFWTDQEERDIEFGAEVRRRAAKKIREDIAAESADVERRHVDQRKHRDLV